MLFLVGVGLSDGDISARATEVLKKKEIELYSENYTCKLDAERIESISKISGKKVTPLQREDMEDGIAKIVERGKGNDIAILVGGDPLIATTHKIIYTEAKKRKVAVSIIHSTSILSAAIGESGLDFYRFGAICTIPRWSEHYKPVSFYETIEKNQSINLHSLLLLDFDKDKESSIQPSDAAAVLDAAEKKYRKGIIKDQTKFIMLHNLSLPDERKEMLEFSELKGVNVGTGSTVLLLPSKLSDMEKETIEAIFGV